jgi:hypothetical protein
MVPGQTMMIITMMMMMMMIRRRRNGASVGNYKHSDDTSIEVHN